MSERKVPPDHELAPILAANMHLTRQQLIDKMGWDIKAANLGRHASRLGYAREFRCPPKIPQGDQLIEILKAHEDLTYKQIHAMYGWEGNPQSVTNAANKAGYYRISRHINIGGGPLDVMSDEEFWGKVNDTFEDRANKMRARAEYGSRSGVVQIRRPAKRRTSELRD